MTTVSLRRATRDDAPAIDAIRAEFSARVFQPLEIPNATDLASTLHTRARGALGATYDGKAQMCVLADGVVCGWVSIDVTSRKHGTASVGYTIGEAWRGHGIATEAVLQGIALALERLEAATAMENLASRRVLTKAGFREEGIARGMLVISGERVDHMRFGLLRTDR